MVYLISCPHQMVGVVSSAVITAAFGEKRTLPLSGWLCLLRTDLPAKEVLNALKPCFSKKDPVFIFEASALRASLCSEETRTAVAKFLSEPEEDPSEFFRVI